MLRFLFKVFSLLIGYTCTAITFIPFFMETSTFSEFLKKYAISYEQFWWITVGLFIVVSIICLIQYIINSKTANSCGKEFESFHEKLLAAQFELRQKNKAPLEYRTHIAFYEFSKSRCQELCECIAQFLKHKFGKDFSVCIKMIDRKSIAKVNKTGRIGEAEVYTFCRAGVSHDSRESREKRRAAYDYSDKKHFCVPVKDNSDFYAILSDDENNKNTTMFACSNLRMNALLSDILGKPEYRNSTPKYWKDYQSTVVVPIQVEKKFVDPKEDDSLLRIYQTVGFLCIDHKKPISTAELNEISGYIKGFGDSLYPLFHEIAIVDRRIVQLEAKN